MNMLREITKHTNYIVRRHCINILDSLPNHENIHVKRYRILISSRPVRSYFIGSGNARHHIFPRCIGGPNIPENIIVLNSREHYIAHLILWKAYGGKLSRAFWLLSNKEGSKITGRLYASLRADIRMSPDTKKKMSISRKGKKIKLTDEGRKALQENGRKNWKKYLKPIIDNGGGMMGKHWSQETYEKFHKSTIGRPKSKEHRQKMSEARRGQPCSEEQLHRLRTLRLGTRLSKEHKQKISEAHKYRVVNEETREKLRIAAKQREEKKRQNGFKQSSETIEKRRKANTGKKRSIESRERSRQAALSQSKERSEKMKKIWIQRKAKKEKQ